MENCIFENFVSFFFFFFFFFVLNELLPLRFYQGLKGPKYEFPPPGTNSEPKGAAELRKLLNLRDDFSFSFEVDKLTTETKVAN
jgi:hypothetical protein